MTRKPLYTGGIATNIGITISDAVRTLGEREERNTEVFEKVYNEQDGKNIFQGMLHGRKGKTTNVTHFQMHAKAADILKMRDEGKPVIPLFYDEVEDRYVLPDSYRDAVLQGYICQHCLEWQGVPNAPYCNWMTVPGDGCGCRMDRE
jgi:hypothetical protein